MINEQTMQKLREMKMSGLADGYRIQSECPDYQKLDFEERFKLLVDKEYARRASNRLQRLILSAEFNDPQACIEDIEYHEDRKLDKSLILRLAAGTYIENKKNIILKGLSGNGKTWLSCAFGIAACRQFYKVKYVRLPELLDELAVAKELADGSFRKIINKYKKVQVLILDEWLLTTLNIEQATILLEITESRHKTASTIFCSQYDPEGWYEKIGDSTLADAILDRIVHDSYSILLGGDKSMRERHGLNYT